MADPRSLEGKLALVTGDSLGQVASQTLENMGAVDRAVEGQPVTSMISASPPRRLASR